MEIKDNIQLYEDKKVRSVWDGEKECWWFSVVDVVCILTESVDPTAYWRKLKQRLREEGNESVTNCHGLKMKAADGKMRLTDVATVEQLFRIIQSIPSPKAEPFKRWLAAVGAERIEETIDPEQAIDRALETYQRKGYSDEWIQQRLMSIKVRNALTDEWQKAGVKKGHEYAILTDEITKAWSDMTTRQYKTLKGLKKENLRDNMSDMELILNMLAESTATNISKKEKPDTFDQSKDIANRGGKVARQARIAVEIETGDSVITNQNAVQLNEVITDLIENVSDIRKNKI